MKSCAPSKKLDLLVFFLFFLRNNNNNWTRGACKYSNEFKREQAKGRRRAATTDNKDPFWLPPLSRSPWICANLYLAVVRFSSLQVAAEQSRHTECSLVSHKDCRKLIRLVCSRTSQILFLSFFPLEFSNSGNHSGLSIIFSSRSLETVRAVKWAWIYSIFL